MLKYPMIVRNTNGSNYAVFKNVDGITLDMFDLFRGKCIMNFYKHSEFEERIKDGTYIILAEPKVDSNTIASLKIEIAGTDSIIAATKAADDLVRALKEIKLAVNCI